MSAELEAELREVRAENDRLRAALAQSDQPCAYCSLPQDEWAKCQNGFPGCARADDAMGCPELGAEVAGEPGSQEHAQTIVRDARALLDRIVLHSPDHGVDEFLDAIRDARLLIAKIDGAE